MRKAQRAPPLPRLLGSLDAVVDVLDVLDLFVVLDAADKSFDRDVVLDHGGVDEFGITGDAELSVRDHFTDASGTVLHVDDVDLRRNKFALLPNVDLSAAGRGGRSDLDVLLAIDAFE